MSAEKTPETLELTLPEGTAGIPLDGAQLMLGAYTGSSEEAVAQHIAELEALGVAPPPSVPCFYVLPLDLLQCPSAPVRTASATTSGEAEPVLIRPAEGELLLGVGSDHTDREVEKASVYSSKRACPKVLGTEAWPLAEVHDRWDELRLSSEVEGGRPYQRDTLGKIRDPLELLELATAEVADPAVPLILFLGTVPLLDSRFHFGSRFHAELSDPAAARTLTCTYQVEVAPSGDAIPPTKTT